MKGSAIEHALYDSDLLINLVPPGDDLLHGLHILCRL